MSTSHFTRRDFIKSTAAAGVAAPYWITSRRAEAAESKNDRPLLAAIGVGGQGTGIAKGAKRFGDFVAVCDVDRNHAERGNKELGGKAEIFEDYRKLLERKDIEAVTIGTPDHWHTAIALAAVRAGKDVYCEKPLTLTDRRRQAAGEGRRRNRPRLPGRHAAAQRRAGSARPANWCATAASANCRK